jgi:hypothetical protein
MKFFLPIAVFLFMHTCAQSQAQFSVFGGPQVTSASYAVKSVKQNTSYKAGFQLGAGMKVPFDTRLFFAPAAFYSMKGYKVKYTLGAYPPDSFATDNNTLFHTFELGFLLQYDFNDKPSHWFIKVGPTLDFQLFGNEKFNSTQAGFVDRKLPFGYDKYGHFSANALLQLGYETQSGFFIFGHYSHGLGNVNNADLGPSIRHRAFGISVGKLFGKNSLVMDTRNKE